MNEIQYQQRENSSKKIIKQNNINNLHEYTKKIKLKNSVRTKMIIFHRKFV